MISQEISRRLHEYLKDVRNKEIKEFLEKPTLIKEDVTVSRIIGMMTKENAHEIFIQLKDKSITCINIRDILSSRNISTVKSSRERGRNPTVTENETVGAAE